MSRTSLIALAVIALCLVAIAYIALDDRRNMPEVAGPQVLRADVVTDQERMARSINEGRDVTKRDATETVQKLAQPDIETAPTAESRRPPLSGAGAAVTLAEKEAANTSSPMHNDFAQFVNEERTGHWAENAESLILDGINFSAFGSAYSDWAVECRTTMCLTVASIDSETYYTQQFLPQGGWIDTMLTVRNDIEPALSFANDGVSGMHRDPETGRIWMLELWWLPDP